MSIQIEQRKVADLKFSHLQINIRGAEGSNLGARVLWRADPAATIQTPIFASVYQFHPKPERSPSRAGAHLRAREGIGVGWFVRLHPSPSVPPAVALKLPPDRRETEHGTDRSGSAEA